MERLLVAATSKTPLVHLDSNKGLIELKGRSTPEDIEKVYLPVLSWIDQYLKNPKQITTVNLHFEYFNSSTTKILVRLLNKMVIVQKQGNTTVNVNWLFYDEDMLEYGEDFQDLTGIEFNFVESDYSEIDFDIANY